MSLNTFAKTVDVLHRAMDANLVRRGVIANNLANAGVPNFKRSEVNFESELKKALNREQQRPPLELKLTDPRHIPNWREQNYRDVEPRRVVDYLSVSRNNGNNVDMEQEVMLALENQMAYTFMAQSQAFEFAQVELALR
ncbi:MAG: flagellar basal body rod protein FlgB [Spirochaetaceae bacterium]|jgi:flagellar basal-body rod protein FlgB|nr:flagellar basal body rod protein FlgB [Spirochaetaceae bacterium]